MTPLDPQQQAALREELARRAAPLTVLTAPQRDVVVGPCNRKSVITPRQCGKTWMACAYMLFVALSVLDANVIYVGLTRTSAKDAAWKQLLEFNSSLALGGTPHPGDLSLTFPNGSRIWMQGLDASHDLKERLRGGQLNLAIIDECGSWKVDLEEVVEEVIRPMMWARKGTVCMISTPGQRKRFFWKVTTGQVAGWQHHSWSMADNPNSVLREEKQKEAERMIRDHGPTWPAYRREYLGEWVADDATHCFPSLLEEQRVVVIQADGSVEYSGGNLVSQLPSLAYGDRWTRILSWDPGNHSALVAMAYSRGQRCLYVYDAWKETGKSLTEVAHQVRYMEARQGAPFDRYIYDSAAQQSAVELVKHQGISWERCQKTNDGQRKSLSVGLMDAGIGARNVLFVVPECQPLLDELRELQWDDELLKADGTQEVGGGQDDHLTDALVYGWRECWHTAADPSRLPVQPSANLGDQMMDVALKAAWRAKQPERDAWRRQQLALEARARRQQARSPAFKRF